MRVTISILLVLLLSVGVVGATSAEENGLESVVSKYVVLMEASTGRILYARNPREQRPMASTTKLMTALVALELSELEEVVSAQDNCIGLEGASLYLEAGEKLYLKDMLYGLILRSGNDVAAVIAQHVAGDISHFASLMNRRAWELGMEDTNFVNPHGLDHPLHYTSAQDLALLAQAALANPALREICATESYTSRELTRGKTRVFINRNKLLERDARAIGLKTGWTENSGACLVAAAEADGIELVAVVMNTPGLYSDVIKLFDYGFEQISMEQILPGGKIMTVLPVRGGKDRRVAVQLAAPVLFPVFADETLSYELKTELPEGLTAPVTRGQVVGGARFVFDDQWEVYAELVASDTVPRETNLVSRFFNWVRGWWD